MDTRRNDPLWEDRRWWGSSSTKHPIEATPRAISSSGSSIGFHPPSRPGFISSASSLRSSPCSSPQAELGDDLYFLTISRAGPGRPSSNPVVAPPRLQVSDGCVPEGSARAHPTRPRVRPSSKRVPELPHEKQSLHREFDNIPKPFRAGESRFRSSQVGSSPDPPSGQPARPRQRRIAGFSVATIMPPQDSVTDLGRSLIRPKTSFTSSRDRGSPIASRFRLRSPARPVENC